MKAHVKQLMTDCALMTLSYEAYKHLELVHMTTKNLIVVSHDRDFILLPSVSNCLYFYAINRFWNKQGAAQC